MINADKPNPDKPEPKASLAKLAKDAKKILSHGLLFDFKPEKLFTQVSLCVLCELCEKILARFIQSKFTKNRFAKTVVSSCIDSAFMILTKIFYPF